MSLQELFDHLQEHRVCKVKLTDSHAANNLRQMLVKKWNKEKKEREDLGFLSEDTKYLVVSMETGKVEVNMQYQEFTFYLRPRKRGKIEYEILGPDNL